MRGANYFLLALGLLLLYPSCKDAKKAQRQAAPEKEVSDTLYTGIYRPQYHFSPPTMWMNDPNGLVFHKGIYHLFYQYYPEDVVWGPMHWGHATSKDLVFWENLPVALIPDEKGYIFSGSAIVDFDNCSGFGTPDKPPLIAVFTYHDPEGERQGRDDFQTQGIAYSLDNGNFWTKYEGNPVIGNDGIRDFRDPKVFWHEATGSWVMVLVAGDRAMFYKSYDLIEWEFLSEFGEMVGAHGGVWECPDLFPLRIEGTKETKWVLTISINPGAPNGGSGTQYFIGDFDGTTFQTTQEEARWLDWGRDNYAGITYNNEPKGELIFIGWMSNWDYARELPTKGFRSAMTVPRELSLQQIGEEVYLKNYPVTNLGTIFKSGMQEDLELNAGESRSIEFEELNQSEIEFVTSSRAFKMVFSNEMGEELVLELDGDRNVFSLDRRRSGQVDFHQKFAPRVQEMPVPNLPEEEVEFRILMDRSSVEVFINGGQYVMTSQLFPNQPYRDLLIHNQGETNMLARRFELSEAESIWE